MAGNLNLLTQTNKQMMDDNDLHEEEIKEPVGMRIQRVFIVSKFTFDDGSGLASSDATVYLEKKRAETEFKALIISDIERHQSEVTEDFLTEFCSNCEACIARKVDVDKNDFLCFSSILCKCETCVNEMIDEALKEQECNYESNIKIDFQNLSNFDDKSDFDMSVNMSAR